LATAEHEHMIQTFSRQTADKPLTHGVGARAS
jgi:hypothetical protein